MSPCLLCIVHFYVQASARNGLGFSEESPLLYAATRATTPDPPLLTSLQALSPSSLQLLWTAPEYSGASSLTGYVIESLIQSLWTPLGPSLGPGETSYLYTGLNRATAYTVRLVALNQQGRGQPSVAATNSTFPSLPHQPENIRAVEVSEEERIFLGGYNNTDESPANLLPIALLDFTCPDPPGPPISSAYPWSAPLPPPPFFSQYAV